MKTCKLCEKEFPATTEYFYLTAGKYLNSYCKGCSKEYAKNWQKAHPEVSKAYYEKNREAFLEYDKKYQIENKEKIRAYKREWYLKRKANG